MLLENKADINLPGIMQKNSSEIVPNKNIEAMVTLLFEKLAKFREFYYALRRGDVETVKMLLQQKTVDVNAKWTNGSTALSEAASNDHETILRAILEQDGVDLY
jgi:hypothetical protein